MITNQITITNYTTNFITNYLTNIIQITNVGLNDNTISIITSKSVIDMLSLIGSIIIPLIAFIYSIWLNNKLNKKNEKQTEEIKKQNLSYRIAYIVKNYFEYYINEIENEYSRVKNYRYGIRYQKYMHIYNTLLDAKEIYNRNIEHIIKSFEMFKTEIDISYNIYCNSLLLIYDYLSRIDEGNYKNYLSNLLEYLKYTLKYIKTIPLVIHSEIYNENINKVEINELYIKIQKLQK
ncbi:hypothetical protein [Brachyspira murdochii]|uniref:hypothetical protein n=2 Tax=Brachyspira murdochii TaxID=84378 RepID=UPI00300618AB